MNHLVVKFDSIRINSVFVRKFFEKWCQRYTKNIQLINFEVSSILVLLCVKVKGIIACCQIEQSQKEIYPVKKNDTLLRVVLPALVCLRFLFLSDFNSVLKNSSVPERGTTKN